MLAINRLTPLGREAAHLSIGLRRAHRGAQRVIPYEEFHQHRHHRRLERHRRSPGARLRSAGSGAALSGRDGQRLHAVAEACRTRGATVDAGQVDVADRAAVAAWLTKFDDAHPVDLVIANAGVSIDKDNSSLDDFSIVRKTFAVNVDGVFNTVEPLIGRLMARRHGQLAVVSSLAGFIGLPYSASYNASKAAVRVWGESIRYVLKKSGIGVSVSCPGFVVTRCGRGTVSSSRCHERGFGDHLWLRANTASPSGRHSGLACGRCRESWAPASGRASLLGRVTGSPATPSRLAVATGAHRHFT